MTLVVTIRGTNDAPVVSIPLADTNQTQIVGWSWGYRIPDGSFTDVDSVPNGETATYTAALADGSPLPGWMKFDAVTRTFSATPAIGTYNANVRVTVTDTAGASVYDDFRVALDIRPPPVALPAPPAPPPPAAAPEPKPLPPPAPDVIIPDRGKGDGGKGDGGTGAGTGSGSGFGEAGGGLAGRANDGGIRALTGLVPLAPTLTAASIGAFRVAVVADTARTTGADAIVIAKPIGEVVQVGLVSFIVPVDAFAHTKADAVVTLHATQADGSPLPSWLQFDAATGRFGGMPPAGQDRALQIKVMARDTTGHEAAQIFKMDVRGNRQAGEIIKPGVRYAFAGRPGLGAQILAVRAGADRIAGLVRMARAS